MLKFFTLDECLGVRIVKPLYALVTGLLALALAVGLLGGVVGIVGALRHGPATAVVAPLAATIAYVVGIGLAALAWRVVCEVLLAVLNAPLGGTGEAKN